VYLAAIGPGARAGWYRALETNPIVSITQTPEWLHCIQACGPYEDRTRLYQTEDGREIVLPLARKRRVPAPLAIDESWPNGWEAGGLLASDGRLFASDIEAVVTDLLDRPTARTRVWIPPVQSGAGEWSAVRSRGLWVWPRSAHILDLADGFPVVWEQRFSGKTRTMCRKGERNGVVVEADRTGRLVPVFDRLYRQSVNRWAARRRMPLTLARRYASRLEPGSKFAAVAHRLGDACTVRITWSHGKPVAGTIVLTHRDYVTFWRGAMDRALVTGTGANEMLHRDAILEACASGCRYYDMGTSPTSSLARFKATIGAEPLAYPRFTMERIPLTMLDTRGRRMVKRLLHMVQDADA
jgi:CelD/BcsL family acetyltransferase involved in cellulose biosynthesis